jgi:hypothetical protein
VLAIRSQSSYCVPSSNKPLGGPEVRPGGVVWYCHGDFPGTSSGSEMKLSVHMDQKRKKTPKKLLLDFYLEEARIQRDVHLAEAARPRGG